MHQSHSPLPWHLELKPSGHTYIKDALGREIGMFQDGVDAELVLRAPELAIENDKLKDKIEDLKRELGY